jgi:hypothetical protein
MSTFERVTYRYAAAGAYITACCDAVTSETEYIDGDLDEYCTGCRAVVVGGRKEFDLATATSTAVMYREPFDCECGGLPV